MKFSARAAGIVTLIAIAAVTATAQVPPEIAAQLRQIGTGVCVPETAKIYAPLQQHAPYAGVTVVRDISYAPDPRTIMDVFTPEKGGGNRPVLIYVSGGGGDKKVNGPDGDAFYDNIMLWALKNGMTGVNMQRRGGLGGGGLAWDEPAKMWAAWWTGSGPTSRCTRVTPTAFFSGPTPQATVPSAPMPRIPKSRVRTARRSKASF